MLTDALKKQIQGAYSQFLENKGLKSRYGQKLMIAEIAKTLGSIELDDDNHREIVERAGGHICVVEAGTGTGKTIAYLLPAIVMASARFLPIGLLPCGLFLLVFRDASLVIIAVSYVALAALPMAILGGIDGSLSTRALMIGLIDGAVLLAVFGLVRACGYRLEKLPGASQSQR